MDMFDFAGMLFGRAGTSQQHSVTASGAASSADGVASITMDADVTPAEDVGEDADQTVIDLPTSPDVAEGDEVIVTLVGDGPLKTPVVTSNPGSGDRMRALANSAKTVADAAQAVAEAVNQHFFADTSGIHVTEATQEDWDVNHSGANVLINSIGQLFRDGLNNLLTLTAENGARALTIWDGLGNAASNIVSSFTGEGADFYSNGSIGMRVGRVSFNGMTKFGLAGYDSDGEVAGLLSVLTSGYMRLHSRYSSSISSSSDRYIGEVEAANTFVRAMLHLPGDAENDPSFLWAISDSGYLEQSHAGFNRWSTPAGTVLWSGSYYMTESHTANLSHNISTCPTGIVLHFQPYTSSTVQNYYHQYCFVPKTTSFAAIHNFTLCTTGFTKVGMKALRIYDDRIVGDDANDDTGTASGITFANNYWVMTQVIAV